MRLRWLAGASLLSLLVVAGSCGEAEGPRRGGRLRVFVSIEPQAFFVEKIADGLAEVEVLVKAGQSPATYAPTPQQVVRLSQADVYFRIGVPFEKALLSKLASSTKRLRIVDTRRGIELRRLEEGDSGDRSHGPLDPHVWMSPRLVKIQAETICDALCRLAPGHAATFRKNLAAFQTELDALDARIAEALAPLRGQEVLVFHPAYGYFADAYGLKQVAVETAGKAPSAKRLVELIEWAKRRGIRVVFVQPQFSDRGARAIAEAIGGIVVPLDPLARDYVGNMEAIARSVEQTLAARKEAGR